MAGLERGAWRFGCWALGSELGRWLESGAMRGRAPKLAPQAQRVRRLQESCGL